MELNVDKCENLVLSQVCAASFGLTNREWVIDDKYATYLNIARSEINDMFMVSKFFQDLSKKSTLVK